MLCMPRTQKKKIILAILKTICLSPKHVYTSNNLTATTIVTIHSETFMFLSCCFFCGVILYI